ncbi:MAG: M15 family metallopeptidase [Thermoleophilia bacterium]
MQRASFFFLVLVVAALVAPAAQADSFSATVSPIPRAMRTTMTGVSWHKGCPVGLGTLRLITSTYHLPAGGTATGQLIVHRDVAPAVKRILKRLWELDYPIAHMDPVDKYGGDDTASIEADNTSAFNCRTATGSSNWSNHAYGYAIDLNPIENPWIENGKVFHKASKPYIDRTQQKSPLEILPGDKVVKAFAAEGWGWGGAWSGGTLDTQHFSITGR